MNRVVVIFCSFLVWQFPIRSVIFRPKHWACVTRDSLLLSFGLMQMRKFYLDPTSHETYPTHFYYSGGMFGTSWEVCAGGKGYPFYTITEKRRYNEASLFLGLYLY